MEERIFKANNMYIGEKGLLWKKKNDGQWHCLNPMAAREKYIYPIEEWQLRSDFNRGLVEIYIEK